MAVQGCAVAFDDYPVGVGSVGSGGAAGMAGAAGASEDAGSDAACASRHLRFPGTEGAHARFPGFVALEPPLTVEFWVRTVPSEQVDVAHVGPEDPCGWGIRVRGDEVHAGVTAAFDHYVQPSLSVEWRHVAWTYDGAESVIFVDGSVAGRKSASAPIGLPGQCTGPLTVGAVLDGGGTPYAWGTGRVDELRTSRTVRYESAFSPERRHGASGASGLWHCDEADGAIEDAAGGVSGQLLGAASRECD